MTTTIEDRMILLLNEQGRLAPSEDERLKGALGNAFGTLLPRPEPRRGYLERLTEYTRISVQRWRKVFHRRQRPTPDMIEALARPHYAFWLVTGITDAANGHVAPDSAQTFPERLYAQSDGASQYFHKSLVLFRRLFEESGVSREDNHQRTYAAEPRTAHQDHCDLYYVPRSPRTTRFALSILNTLPTELTGEELTRLRTWLKQLHDDDLSVFFQYIEHHGIDRKLIFSWEPGTMRFAWLGMAESEIDRFVNYVQSLRSSRPRDTYPARTG